MGTNPPAFPSHEAGTSDPRNGTTGGGMSLRDYFAAKALTGICLNEFQRDFSQESYAQTAARVAYTLADAMLAQREKEVSNG